MADCRIIEAQVQATNIEPILDKYNVTWTPQHRHDRYPVIPDYAIWLNNQIVGYVEAKASNVPIDPKKWLKGKYKSAHNTKQWGYLSKLDNVIYTNGTDWVLYHKGAEVQRVKVENPEALINGTETNAALESMFNNISEWDIDPVTTVSRFLSMIVPVAKELAGNITEIIGEERRANKGSTPVVTTLDALIEAQIIPADKNETYGDEISNSFIFSQLGAKGSLAHSRERKLLSAVHHMVEAATQKYPNVKTLVDHVTQIIAAVNWAEMQATYDGDLAEGLFEDYLESYDRTKRFDSGSFYTPKGLVEGMVKLVAEVTEAYHKPLAECSVVDPATGTATFPLEFIDTVAESTSGGARATVLRQFVDKMHLWDTQVTPIAIAMDRIGLRLDELKVTSMPHIMIRDSLLSPKAEIGENALFSLTDSGDTIREIAQEELDFYRDGDVDIIGGNPPYDATSLAHYEWVQEKVNEWKGGASGGGKTISNLSTAFLRMQAWQAWEKPGTDHGGIVYAVMPTAWLMSKETGVMRAWFRKKASRIWVINLTPEGYMSGNAVFNISTAVSVVIMQRDVSEAETSNAPVYYRSVDSVPAGEKIQQLFSYSISDNGWYEVEGLESDPFLYSEWAKWPACMDILPWSEAGTVPNRKWVTSVSKKTIINRLNKLQENRDNEEVCKDLFHTTTGTGWHLRKRNATNAPGFKNTPIAPKDDNEFFKDVSLQVIMTKPLTREFLIADTRTVIAPRASLWASSSIDTNTFFITANFCNQFAVSAITTEVVPACLLFGGAGSERAYPLYHPNGEPNIATGLIEFLADHYGYEVTPRDIVDYLTGVIAHPGFTEEFKADLQAQIIRVPFTKDGALFKEAVKLGAQVSKLTSTDVNDLEIKDHDIEEGWVRQISGVADQTEWVNSNTAEDTVIEGTARVLGRVTDGVLKVGDFEMTGVDPRVATYKIGGSTVLQKWLERRLPVPYGKSTSPLDLIMPEHWGLYWDNELAGLVRVITALISLEAAQSDLLARIIEGECFNASELPGGGSVKAQWPELETDAEGETLF